MINMLRLFHLEKRNVPNNPISRCVSFRNNYKNRAPKNRGFVSSHFFGFDCFPTCLWTFRLPTDQHEELQGWVVLYRRVLTLFVLHVFHFHLESRVHTPATPSHSGLALFYSTFELSPVPLLTK